MPPLSLIFKVVKLKAVSLILNAGASTEARTMSGLQISAVVDKYAGKDNKALKKQILDDVRRSKTVAKRSGDEIARKSPPAYLRSSNDITRSV